MFSLRKKLECQHSCKIYDRYSCLSFCSHSFSHIPYIFLILAPPTVNYILKYLQMSYGYSGRWFFSLYLNIKMSWGWMDNILSSSGNPFPWPFLFQVGLPPLCERWLFIRMGYKFWVCLRDEKPICVFYSFIEKKSANRIGVLLGYSVIPKEITFWVGYFQSN